MRLTIQKRKSVLDAEVSSKYHAKLIKTEKEFYDECGAMALKKKPKWITDEMIDSRFIKLAFDFSIDGESRTYRLIQRMKYTRGTRLYSAAPTNGYEVKIEKSKKLIKIIKDREVLNKEVDKFKSELRQVLSSYTTSEKLVKSVPELHKHFKDEIVSSALVPIDTINRVRKSLKTQG